MCVCVRAHTHTHIEDIQLTEKYASITEHSAMLLLCALLEINYYSNSALLCFDNAAVQMQNCAIINPRVMTVKRPDISFYWQLLARLFATANIFKPLLSFKQI